MSNVDKIAKDLAGIIKSSDSKATAPYDTKATVKKVENGTAWVQIPGGVDETPVQMTLNAKEGDTVQVRVSGGRAWITGNGTNPPTDDTRANQAYNIADSAIVDAQRAKNAADNAEASAADAKATANAVHDIAVEAKQDAAEAEAAATTANTAATGALTGLSTVQDVIGMLNWAQENATYSLTQDTDIMPGKTYWTRSGAGTAADPYVYTPVPNPVKTALGTYYEITGVDEAMGDFINAHLALTEEGLWILPDGMDTASYRVLIATGGQGHTYEDAGTYIIDTAGKTVAKLGKVITLGDTEAQAHLHLDYHSIQLKDKNNNVNSVYFHVSDIKDEEGYVTENYVSDGVQRDFVVSFPLDSGNDMHMYVDDTEITGFTVDVALSYIELNSGTATPAQGATIKFRYKPEDGVENAWTRAFTFGWRRGNIGDNIGGLSFSEGDGNVASGWCAHAEGEITRSLGEASHAEGADTEAGDVCHAEGLSTVASGRCSHAQNRGTKAVKEDQTVIGRYNKVDTASLVENQKAFIIGNGTSGNRSNALTVDWQGNVDIASGAKYKINGTALSASDVGAVPTTRKVNNKALSSDITLNASDVSALPISGGTITGDLTVNGDTTLEGVTYLGLDVDSSASKTTPATSGKDKDLFNAIRDLGWYDDVIA